MPTDTPRRHALLDITAKSLRSAKPDDRGFVFPKARGAFDVVVGQPSVERALVILQQFVDAATQQGMRVRVDPERSTTVVHVDGEKVALRLIEDKDRKKHKLIAEERAYTKTDRWFHPIPEWDYFPSGVLAFQVTESGVYDTRRRWGEGPRGPLETKIPSLLDGLKKIAASMAEARARRALWEQEARERERIDAERRIREWKVQSFREAILKQAEGWNAATMLRAYVDAVEQEATVRGRNSAPEFQRWSSWARAVATSFDPLTRPNPPWEMEVPEWEPAR